MFRNLMSVIPIRTFLRDRRGNVLIMFAGVSIALALLVGAAVDYSRASQFKAALQGLADASALAGASVYVSSATAAQGIAEATAYWNAGLSKLPPNSGVGTPSVTSSSDSGGYYIQVAVPISTIKTTFLSLVMSSINVAVTAKAKDPIVTANINFNGWSSSAGDGNSVYWYKVPEDQSVPAFNQTNINNGTYNLVFSNTSTNTPVLSFSIAAAQQVAFAFVNSIGANSPGWYYCNQYGACSTANSNPTHIFYSQFSNPNSVNSTTAPSGSGYTDATKYTGGTIQNCALQVRTYTGTAPTDPLTTGSCTTPPSQANINPYFSPSCASLGGTLVHYSWNDMGGTNGQTPSQDDKDYNDGQYNFNCTGGGTTTGVILTD
jgi:Flp pilus assembly protein TadG